MIGVKVDKSQRIGIRVAPAKKQEWESFAAAWGYKSLSSWMTSMLDWAIAYEKYDGDHEAFLKAMKKEQNNV